MLQCIYPASTADDYHATMLDAAVWNSATLRHDEDQSRGSAGKDAQSGFAWNAAAALRRARAQCKTPELQYAQPARHVPDTASAVCSAFAMSRSGEGGFQILQKKSSRQQRHQLKLFRIVLVTSEIMHGCRPITGSGRNTAVHQAEEAPMLGRRRASR